MSPLESMWIWFLVALLVSVVAMKLISVKSDRAESPRLEFVFLSPVFSLVSWRKRKRVDPVILRQVLIRALLQFLIVWASWRLYHFFVLALRPAVWAQGYLAAFPVCFLGQFCSAVLELIYLPTGWHYPAHFKHPPLSSSVSEFWGRRWGTWVTDWFHEVIFRRYRRSPMMGIFMVFVASGLWHELLLNVPLYLFFGVNLLGSWLLYFLIQGVAVLGERRIFTKLGFASRAYTWLAVLLPAPLALNVGALRMLGLLVR